MQLLWICRCSGVEPYAITAYKGFYPLAPVPKIVKGGDILKEHLPSSLSAVAERLYRKRGRYAYFFKWTDAGEGHIRNLLTGRDLA